MFFFSFLVISIIIEEWQYVSEGMPGWIAEAAVCWCKYFVMLIFYFLCNR